MDDALERLARIRRGVQGVAKAYRGGSFLKPVVNLMDAIDRELELLEVDIRHAMEVANEQAKG